ncbi:sugar transferase [Nocardioides jensenii]|uniref:sugar transferase n=1 Tax=Nocardioides jensenii TaxID=1843 RepID=UPI0014703FF4|nr:sugar transferase [Nocardioides jensenii]
MVRKARASRRVGFVIGDAVAAFLACLAIPGPVELLAVPLLWVALVAVMRGYESRLVFAGVEDLRRVVRAGLALVVVGAGISWVVDLPSEPGMLLTLVAVTTGGAIAQRVGWAGVQRWRREHGQGVTHRVMLAGHQNEVAQLATELARTRGHGFEVVASCTHGKRNPLAGVAAHAREARVDAVIVLPCKHFGATTLRRLGWELATTHTQMFMAPGLTDVAEGRTTVTTVGNLPMLHVREAELHGWRRILKEAWERLAALCILLLLAPVLIALMIAIRVESPGPAIFRQTRVGRDDEPFTMFKLRTMCDRAEQQCQELAARNEVDGVLFKVRNDPRVTRIGRLLRRYSLDELPQLFNVVLGDMALIGPRPPLPHEVEQYADDVRRRLAVKPGVTGLWQVSGRSDLPWEEAVRLDLRYVDNWSLGLDLSIMLRTARAVVSHQGAY